MFDGMMYVGSVDPVTSGYMIYSNKAFSATRTQIRFDGGTLPWPY